MAHTKPVVRMAKDSRGLAAIEFALISPVLVGIVLLLADVAGFVALNSGMKYGVRTGVQYIMNGGTDSAATTAVVNQAWTNKPSNATVSVTTTCVCASTPVTCGTTCSGGGTPQTLKTIAATAPFSGFLLSLSATASETVRVS
jgi:Flp pilus assembly protein TadG